MVLRKMVSDEKLWGSTRFVPLLYLAIGCDNWAFDCLNGKIWRSSRRLFPGPILPRPIFGNVLVTCQVPAK